MVKVFMDIILTSISFIITPLLELLPDFNLIIPDHIFDGVHQIMYGIGYIVPVKGLLPIVALGFVLINFQIGVAIVIRFKSFFPTMGA